MARRPEGDQRPAPRPVSNRRHGAPALPSPLMMAARRSRAAWLRFRAPPVDRQHPVAPSRNPAPASTPPVDGRLVPVRPASARRPASEPPSTRPHTPNRQRGALLWPAQPGSDPFGRRSAACRPAHQRSVRCDLALNPAPAARLSGPLAAAYADPSGTPGSPTPAPRSVPGGATAGWGTYARACVAQKFSERNQKDGDPAIQQGGLIHMSTGASVYRFPWMGWKATGGWAASTGAHKVRVTTKRDRPIGRHGGGYRWCPTQRSQC